MYRNLIPTSSAVQTSLFHRRMQKRRLEGEATPHQMLEPFGCTRQQQRSPFPTWALAAFPSTGQPGAAHQVLQSSLYTGQPGGSRETAGAPSQPGSALAGNHTKQPLPSIRHPLRRMEKQQLGQPPNFFPTFLGFSHFCVAPNWFFLQGSVALWFKIGSPYHFTSDIGQNVSEPTKENGNRRLHHWTHYYSSALWDDSSHAELFPCLSLAKREHYQYRLVGGLINMKVAWLTM